MTAESASPTPPPFKDPKPTAERILQLAGRVRSGDILLPRFQRNFVWSRKQILDLLDSVGRNYPIGSMLLWQTKQELANERTIAGLSIAESKPDYPVNYLLDGQQRLSADRAGRMAGDAGKRVIRPLHGLPGCDRHAWRHVIKDVAPVFERINSTGTPLTFVDLMRAATWSPTFDLVDSMDEILNSLEPKNFHGIERKTILRAVAAAAELGFDSGSMDALRDRTQVQIESDVAETHEASKRAADFLSTQIGAPNAKSLPYVNQFAVLAEVFRRLPGPTSDQYAAIRRWFWRTTLTSYFGGWNTGQMAIDRQAIISFAAGDTSEIENSSVVPTQSIWSVREFRANSATSKMLALMLSHTCPVDLVTGQTIDVAKSLTWSNDKEYHHFFPKKHLAGTGVPTRRANVVANIVMLTSISNIQISASAPSVYLTKIAKEVGETELRRRLETSLVRAEAYAAALDDDYPAFIAARSATLQARAMELVGSVGTSPGLGTLTATDESIVDDADGDLE